MICVRRPLLSTVALLGGNCSKLHPTFHDKNRTTEPLGENVNAYSQFIYLEDVSTWCDGNMKPLLFGNDEMGCTGEYFKIPQMSNTLQFLIKSISV